MARLHVRRAAAADVASVAATLGAAFEADPWIAWIVAAERHQERVTALQASLIGVVGIPFGEVWLAEGDSGDVVGGALWLLADQAVPAATWAEVAAVEAELMGDRHANALSAAAATRHLRPTTPHHLLASLGVLPSEQGRGIGTALVAPVLARADRGRVDTYVETSSERNLRLYGRLGFCVTDEVQLADGGPPVWALIRHPR